MMTRTRLAILGIALCSMVYSCKKDNNVSTTTSGYTSIQQVYGALALQPKSATIDATTGGSVYGNSGTRYVFTGGSFMNASGATVTGTIDLKLTEYLKKGDMLFSKIIPISNGQPLLSGGEVNVVATQGGQPVYLKAGYTFEARVPTEGTPPAGMQLFTGQPVEDTTQVKANWVLAKADSARANVGVFTYPGIDTLNILSDSLKLCNADMFLTAPSYQTFIVNVVASGATVPSSGVYGYALYDSYKGVWPMFSFSDGKFNEGHVPNIPVHFAVFTIIGGKFYGGTLGVTPATGSTYTVTLTEQDAAAFKTQLNNL